MPLEWTNPRKEDQIYYFDFSSNEEKFINGLEAAIFTVEKIVSSYPPPYILFLSGGVDSQAMLYAWIKSNKPFQTFSARYNENLNDYDLKELDLFSKMYKININFYNFDLIKFLETEHKDYSSRYFCGSPQITTMMKLADLQNKGTIILSGNFIQKIHDVYHGLPLKNQYGLYHYSKLSGKNVVPFFFLETSELAHAFKINKHLKIFDKHQDLDGYKNKILLYLAHGFPIIPQVKKYNGFEKIKEIYDVNSPRPPTIEERLQFCENQVSRRNFDLLYRNKYEKKVSNIKYYVSINNQLIIV